MSALQWLFILVHEFTMFVWKNITVPTFFLLLIITFIYTFHYFGATDYWLNPLKRLLSAGVAQVIKKPFEAAYCSLLVWVILYTCWRFEREQMYFTHLYYYYKEIVIDYYIASIAWFWYTVERIVQASGVLNYFSLNSVGLTLTVLTTFLYFILYFYIPKTVINRNFFIFLFTLSYLTLVICFNTSNFFVFYIFFEFILIPFYFIVGMWGSRVNRFGAAFRLVFFTIIFSLPLGIFTFINLISGDFSFNFNIITSTILPLGPFFSTYFYISAFIAFAVKIPLFPAHVWLPEAHGEAPTFGSVLLAGILLKLGGYGFLRVFYPLVNEFYFDYTVSFFPLVYTVSVVTILYSNISVFVQVDIKKTIAYYSIGHIGFVTLGLATGTIEGFQGAMAIIIAHGLSAAGLFFIVGYLYEQSHTRSLFIFRGLATVAPAFSIFFFFFICANMSMPGTINFIGEQLVILSLVKFSVYSTILPFIGIFINGVSSILFMNRLLFGETNQLSCEIRDINKREVCTYACVLLPLVMLGFVPTLFLNLFNF